MARRKGSNVMDDLVMLPWQINLAMMLIVYFGMSYIPLSIEAESPVAKGILAGLPNLAPIFALLFLVAAVLSAIKSIKLKSKSISSATIPLNRNRQRVPLQIANQETVKQNEISFYQSVAPVQRAKPDAIDLPLLNRIEWKRFEVLCLAYLEIKVGRAEETRVGADGGVDIRVFGNDPDRPIALVQCKAWNAYKVGVKPVRELFGVMAAEGVTTGIFMTSGIYTPEAQSFAANHKLALISGEALVASIRKMQQADQEHLLAVVTEGDYEIPTCPSCNVKMIGRRSSRGKNAGSTFWGCINYPRCKQTFKKHN